jgi:signal transduction histidine kinase
MRQPVATVAALAAAALAEPGLPPAARSRLEQIADQAGWLADLLRHSLPGSGQDEASPCRTDLLWVTGEAVAAECITWPGEARILGPGEPVDTPVHPVLLRRMAANLLGNAMRAAGPSGTVTAWVGRDGDCAVLRVEDNGPGFGKIGKGLGLGLAAVARTAAKNGGTLAYGSRAGGGAWACLRLPVSAGSR